MLVLDLQYFVIIFDRFYTLQTCTDLKPINSFVKFGKHSGKH